MVRYRMVNESENFSKLKKLKTFLLFLTRRVLRLFLFFLGL